MLVAGKHDRHGNLPAAGQPRARSAASRSTAGSSPRPARRRSDWRSRDSGQINPQQGGPYAYARDFLGPFAGFQTNYIYWFGNWVGNIAIAVAAVGYLAELGARHIDGPPGQHRRHGAGALGR
jgi:hypothetical protein